MKISTLPFIKDVQTVLPGDPVSNALQLFRDHKIGSVVITDQARKVLGIFTERDVIYMVAGQDSSALEKPIETYMTPNPKSVVLEDPVMKAAISMRLGRFRHIVVVDESNTLVGIGAIKDILGWMMDSLSEQ